MNRSRLVSLVACIALLGGCCEPESPCRKTTPSDEKGMAVAGILLSVGAVIAIVAWLMPNKHEQHDDPPPPSAVPERDRAIALHREARAAAAKDDCATVVKLDVEISGVDREYHDTVFVDDAPIQRCLAGPAH